MAAIHPDLTMTSTYAHLRGSDLGLLRDAVQLQANWAAITEVLIRFASEAGERLNIDGEALYMLGRQLSRILPAQLKRTLLLNVRTLPPAVSAPLSAGLMFSGEPKKRAPLPVELKRLVTLLQGNPDALLEEKIRSFHSRHLADVAASGREEDMIKATVTVSRLLLRRSAKTKVPAAQLAQDIVRDALVWQPNNATLWFFWCVGLEREQAHAEAEDLLWNGIRRFPDDVRFRSALIQMLLISPGRNAEAVALGRENRKLFGDTAWTIPQLSQSLSRTGQIEDAKEALLLLSTFASGQHGRSFYVATGMMADILLRWSEKAPDRLEELLLDFPSKTLAGTVAMQARVNNPSSPVARMILRQLIAKDPEDRQTKNALAKALWAAGDPESMTEAEAILRANVASDAGDRFAVAQLVGLLESQDRPGWRSEALSLLQRTLEENSDPILETRYARLLTGGDERQREEARGILERIAADDPGNPHVALALAVWQETGSSPDRNTELVRLLRPLVANPEFRGAALGILQEAGIPADSFPPPPHATALRDEVIDVTDTVYEGDIDARQPVPQSLRRWGRLRRRRFLIENGFDVLEDDVDTTDHKRVSELIYLNVLEIRRGGEIDDLVQGTFQVALERAVHARDPKALSVLSEKFPRFAAITLLAKAMLGDPVARVALDALLRGPKQEGLLEQILATRLSKIGKLPLDFEANAELIARSLHDLNEMTISERLAA